MILLLQLTVKNRSLFPWNEARDRKRIKHLWDLFDDRPVRQRDAICENFIAFLLKLLRNEFPFAYFFRCEVYSPDFDTRGMKRFVFERDVSFICLLFVFYLFHLFEVCNLLITSLWKYMGEGIMNVWMYFDKRFWKSENLSRNFNKTMIILCY